MPNLKVIWEDDAIRLLEGRDRYTRNAIRDEFRSDPEKGAIEFDPEQHTFLTPVSDNRFSVIWRRDEQAQQAVVRAVVSLPNLNLNAPVEPSQLAELKEYVQRAVKVESKGAISA